MHISVTGRVGERFCLFLIGVGVTRPGPLLVNIMLVSGVAQAGERLLKFRNDLFFILRRDCNQVYFSLLTGTLLFTGISVGTGFFLVRGCGGYVHPDSKSKNRGNVNLVPLFI